MATTFHCLLSGVRLSEPGPVAAAGFRLQAIDLRVDAETAVALEGAGVLHGLSGELVAHFVRFSAIECSVSGAGSHLEALDAVRDLRMALYARGLSPFVVPTVATLRASELAGLARDPDALSAAGADDDAHASARVWAQELIPAPARIELAAVLYTSWLPDALADVTTWASLCQAQPSLLRIRAGLEAAPLVRPWQEGLLHLWTAIEALFPEVRNELRFKLSLYLTQLTKPLDYDLHEYQRRVQGAYDLRSDVAHGTVREVDSAEWLDAWELLLDGYRAVLRRGGLPGERELIRELLTSSSQESPGR